MTIVVSTRPGDPPRPRVAHCHDMHPHDGHETWQDGETKWCPGVRFCGSGRIY
jgi:hypothetical protein